MLRLGAGNAGLPGGLTPWATTERGDPMSTDKRCRATNRGGQPCGQPPVPGALVCHYHGGAAGQVKRRAAERVAVAKARTILDGHRVTPVTILDGHRVTPVTDPLTALMEVAGEVVAFKVYLSERAGELASSADSDEERATLGAYERALDRCGRILVDMAKLNLDERITRLAEGQAQMLGAVVLSVLSSTELALTETQLTTARNAIATELLALDAGEAS